MSYGQSGQRDGTAITPRRGVLRALALSIVALLVTTAIPGAVIAQSESPAERAAREIREARDRANAAADAYFEAESRLDVLEFELVGLQAEEVQLQATVDRLRRDVEGVAIGQFVSSGADGIPLLTDVSDPQDQIQTEVFVDILTNSGADTIDQYEAAQRALEETQAEVADRQDEIEAQQDLFLRLQEEANDEVERLREIEEERLQDEAVQRALEAQLAAERARLEEEARLEAEAAARAQPNPGLVTTTSELPPDSTAPDDAAGATGAAPAPSTTTTPPVTVDPNDPDATLPSTSTTTTTTPPASTLPPNRGESGGTSGGRTGQGGAGSNPIGINAGGNYIDNIVCPIRGSAYGDTWGAPRSGGRRHQGVDMIAPEGVPLYAVVDGVVTFKQNRLGGNAVSLVGDNGNRYYYAHLSAYEGASGRRVTAGEVIGYNGNTGNSSTPHLHLQIHPGGGQPVNPYPSVVAAGC